MARGWVHVSLRKLHAHVSLHVPTTGVNDEPQTEHLGTLYTHSAWRANAKETLTPPLARVIDTSRTWPVVKGCDICVCSSWWLRACACMCTCMWTKDIFNIYHPSKLEWTSQSSSSPRRSWQMLFQWTILGLDSLLSSAMATSHLKTQVAWRKTIQQLSKSRQIVSQFWLRQKQFGKIHSTAN